MCNYCIIREQTLANETPPTGKIHQFSKIGVTFKPVKRLMSFKMENVLNLCDIIYVITGRAISTVLAWRPRKAVGRKRISESVTESIRHNAVCRQNIRWLVLGNILSRFQSPNSYGLGAKVF